MKILIVEDDAEQGRYLQKGLREAGHITQLADNGRDGLFLGTTENFDAIVLDRMLPQVDGLTILRTLRASGKDLPIIVLSALGEVDERIEGLRAGGDDYLVKPVSEMVLRAKIRAMQRIAQMRYSLLVLTRKLDEANRELKRLSAVDGLTSIANRRSFDDALAKEWRRAARNEASLALLLVDVDFFKQFNDNYGHQLGDECLKAVARTLDAQLRRPGDLVARFGGEEFVVLLPQTDSAGAERVADSLRVAIEQLGITHGHSQAGDVVTVSIGLAAARPARDASGPDALVDGADRALYGAKRQGRNRVCNSGMVAAGVQAEHASALDH